MRSALCIEEHRLKFLPLIWSGIWRKPGRSILIFLQVSVAFALFGVLQGMKTGVEQLISRARADLLLVHGSLSFIERLPLGLFTQIKSVPGARVVVPVDLFGGMYQKPDQQVGIVGSDRTASGLRRSPTRSPRNTPQRSRTHEPAPWSGSLCWPIRLENRPADSSRHLAGKERRRDGLGVDIVGTYTDTDMAGGSDVILINYDYFDEARVAGKGTVNHFNVAISDPKEAVGWPMRSTGASLIPRTQRALNRCGSWLSCRCKRSAIWIS